MPSKEISIEEYGRVVKWMGDQWVGDLHGMLYVHIVNGEPFVLRGRFRIVIPWSNMLNLSFRTVTTGSAHLACSDNHARQLEADRVISFAEQIQQGARTP